MTREFPWSSPVAAAPPEPTAVSALPLVGAGRLELPTSCSQTKRWLQRPVPVDHERDALSGSGSGNEDFDSIVGIPPVADPCGADVPSERAGDDQAQPPERDTEEERNG